MLKEQSDSLIWGFCGRIGCGHNALNDIYCDGCGAGFYDIKGWRYLYEYTPEDNIFSERFEDL